jgi:asparagine synthase (glutamine-hydrolysing)
VLEPEFVAAGLPRFWEAYDALSQRRRTHDEAGVRALETDIYMRNVLLRDADWAGMAHGVEIRAPLVDVPLYRALCDSSDRCAYRKEDLRLLANRLNPALQLAPRAKTGFTVPRSDSGSGGRAAGAREIAFGAQGLRTWNRRVLRHWFGEWAT